MPISAIIFIFAERLDIIEDTYEASVGSFVKTFGNQDKVVEIGDLDLDNQVQIDTRLKLKPLTSTVKTKKQIVNKK